MARMGVVYTMSSLFLLVLGVDAVEGRFAAYNETRVHESNLATFRDLMDSGVGYEDAVETCMRHVQSMRQKFAEPEIYSFPSAEFMPEGAREWCECLVANPPRIDGYRPLSSYRDDYMYGDLSDYQSRVPQGLRNAYDASFDQCRAQVLEGSNINTVDICRGMFSLFGQKLNTLEVSFCGKLCRDPDNVTFHPYLSSPEFEFNFDCADRCAREAMPGYCSNTLLEYSNFVSLRGIGPTGNSVTRSVNVSGKRILTQSLLDAEPVSREDLSKLCSALEPALGSKNECCNYAKGFSLMQQCCVLDKEGRAIFDCNSVTADDLYRMCTVENNPWPEWFSSYYEHFCSTVLNKYRSNPEYAGKAKVYGTTVQFPTKLLESVCESYGYEAGTVCCVATGIPFVQNCVAPEARQPYIGQVMGERPTMPTAGAPPSGAADPCHGLCGEDRECVVDHSGNAFCTECSALLRPLSNGSVGECCRYNPEKMKCENARKGQQPGMCLRNHDLLFTTEGGKHVKARFTKKQGYACSSPRDFRRAGKACRVVVNSSGSARCYE